MLASNGALGWSNMVILLWLIRLRQNNRVLAKLRLRGLFIVKKKIKKNCDLTNSHTKNVHKRDLGIYKHYNLTLYHCYLKRSGKVNSIFSPFARMLLMLCQLFLLTFPQWTRVWLESYVKLHYPPGPGAYVFFIPDVASHELTVNMQDGHASQAKCCWAEESPGKFYQLHFRQVCGNSSAYDVQLSKVFGW